MLYSLRDRSLENLNWTNTPEFNPKLSENVHDSEENSHQIGNETEFNNTISSQLREIYYSPLATGVTYDHKKDQLRGLDTEEIGYAQEKEIVLELIYLLKGQDCSHFKKVNNQYFQMNMNVTNRNRQIISKICTLAKMYHRVREVGLESSLMMDSVYQAIMEELEELRKLLDALNLNYDHQSIGLLDLYSLLHKPYSKVRLLYNLVSSNKFTPDYFYECAARGDVMSRELFTSLLKKALVPYFETIYKWLYLGELSSEKVDFFVTTEYDNRHGKRKLRPNLSGIDDFGDAGSSVSKSDSRKYISRETGDTHTDEDGDLVCDNFYFNRSKVFKFFPMDLAKEIYEQGNLSHCLKRLSLSESSMTLDSFMFEVFGEDKPIEESLVSLSRCVSKLNYSTELARMMLDNGSLGDYVSALCTQFVSFHNHNKYLKNNYNMTEKVENGIKVYYPGPKLPYNLVVDDYRVFRQMIKVSAMFKSAVISLNESYSEYIVLNRSNNRVLELSKVLNRLNFHRGEMSNFLFSVQPYQNAAHCLSLYLSSLSNCRNLDSIRKCNRNLAQNLNYRFYSELSTILLNVIEFGKSMSDLFKQDMRHIGSVGFRGSQNLVDFIDNELVDFASTCVKSAELFRYNILTLLSKFKNKSLLLDFNEYYKFNSTIK